MPKKGRVQLAKGKHNYNFFIMNWIRFSSQNSLDTCIFRVYQNVDGEAKTSLTTLPKMDRKLFWTSRINVSQVTHVTFHSRLIRKLASSTSVTEIACVSTL